MEADDYAVVKGNNLLEANRRSAQEQVAPAMHDERVSTEGVVSAATAQYRK